MTAAILSIGTELTRGELVDTNATWLAEQLIALGFDVPEHATVEDEAGVIVEALQRLAARAKVVIVTGGLGPTSDDLTAAAAAQAGAQALVRDPVVLDVIKKKYASFGRVMPEENAKQADRPEKATVIPNPVGTAPGFAMPLGNATCYFMPGVPREMRHLFRETVVPAIAGQAERNTHQLHLRTFGRTESRVAGLLQGVEEEFGVTLGYRASFPEIEVKIHARAATEADAERMAREAAGAVRQRLGDCIFGEREDTFPDAVGRALRDKGITLALAESCTGGMAATMLTSVPGSSDYLLLSAVAYANSAKSRMLGVNPEVIRAHGAVSAEVAAEMAEGARRISGASLAVSITGIAGPGGGSEDKPVGTVWFGLAAEGHPTVTRHRLFPGERDQIRTLAAYTALRLAMRSALGHVGD
ncbi:MAG: competence/damage-inducible protein A [Myxococcales bacterium]|nr:competence/damage-inducible protein A [Myxococcales bacterium]MCB9628740.1 competence/damage-inducible protein A [Sandaracinaceae bacterium]